MFCTNNVITIFVVYHTQTGNTKRLAEAVADGADSIKNVKVILKEAGDATLEDLITFINCWMVPYDCFGGDIDFSGTVDYFDLNILCQNWLAE